MEHHYDITPAELLFLTHPNNCSGLDLIKITVLDMVFKGQLNLEFEKRLIRRKRAGDIEKVFFIIQRITGESLNSYQDLIFDNASDNGMILQHFIRKLDQSLNGIEVFKYEVFKELYKKKWVKSSFTLFGLLKPKYRLTKAGNEVKGKFHTTSQDQNQAFNLISKDKKIILKKMVEIEDALPQKHSRLKYIKSKDWEGASKRSGLDPRGFMPR